MRFYSVSLIGFSYEGGSRGKREKVESEVVTADVSSFTPTGFKNGTFHPSGMLTGHKGAVGASTSKYH